MKTHFRSQIILTVSLFFVIVFNANAQNEFIQNSVLENHISELTSQHLFNKKMSINSLAIPNEKYKIEFSNEKLDSLISTSTTGEGAKHLFDYDQNDNMIEWLALFYSSGQWENSFKHQFSYENDLKVIELLLGWSQTVWDSLLIIEYSYSESGLLLQRISRDYFNGIWEPVSKTTHKYNTDSLLSFSLSESWENGQWVNNFASEYVYNDRKLIDSLIGRIWSQGDWVNYWNTHFYYSEGFIEPDSIIGKTWGNNTWINLTMRINHRIGGNDIEQIEKDWNGTEWVNFARRLYERDEDRFLEFAKFEFWNGTNWVAENGDLMIDNPDGFIAALITHQVNCYNSLITSVEEENISSPEDFILYQNYPNPFNPSTTIEYSIPVDVKSKMSKVKLVVYDLLGSVVHTLVDEQKSAGKHKVTFDASQLPSGVYFYQITANSFNQVKKMLLLK